MPFPRNEACPCGKGVKFKKCHGQSPEALHDLHAAVHEIGHASVLPKRTKPHVSFQNPCSLCAGEEAEQMARAHVGYAPGAELTGVDQLLYSLAGGAAESACGLFPITEQSAFGTFPASMQNDLLNLKDELAGEMWEFVEPRLRTCFNMIVDHLRQRSDAIWQNARRLLVNKVLMSEEMELDFVDRNILLQNISTLLGIPEPPAQAL